MGLLPLTRIRVLRGGGCRVWGGATATEHPRGTRCKGRGGMAMGWKGAVQGGFRLRGGVEGEAGRPNLIVGEGIRGGAIAEGFIYARGFSKKRECFSAGPSVRMWAFLFLISLSLSDLECTSFYARNKKVRAAQHSARKEMHLASLAKGTVTLLKVGGRSITLARTSIPWHSTEVAPNHTSPDINPMAQY
jgi:hypothetical protein